MSIYTCLHTHTEPHVGGQRSSGPPPQPCCMCSLCSSTPFPPDRCSCSAPSGSGSGRHKGCLCYKPSASQTVYGTLGLTCPPVQMLMNRDIVLIFFFCFAFPVACVLKNTVKRLLSLSFIQLISFVCQTVSKMQL